LGVGIYPLLRQDAIGAQLNPGGSDFRLTCKSHLHSQRIARRGVGVRRPWREKESLRRRTEGKDDEKIAQRAKSATEKKWW
jgi:hypothetical protein